MNKYFQSVLTDFVYQTGQGPGFIPWLIYYNSVHAKTLMYCVEPCRTLSGSIYQSGEL